MIIISGKIMEIKDARITSPHFGKRNTCVGCPHGQLMDDPEQVANDLEEADYKCELLADCEPGISWGETPLCKLGIIE